MSNVVNISITTNYYYTSLFTNFNLHRDNNGPYGITVYNNQFHIIDFNRGKRYIYNNTGTIKLILL